jgi:DNA-binding NarL/FixJ family response regulator
MTSAVGTQATSHDLSSESAIRRKTDNSVKDLADLRMPQMDGFEGLRALRRLLPRTPIMVLSASEEAADLFGALETGASGYLRKSAPAPVILEALRLVLAGGVYVPRELVFGYRPCIASSIRRATRKNGASAVPRV